MHILLLLLLNIGFSQIVQHNPIRTSLSNESIDFNIFIDNNSREINKVSLMYKNIEQSQYLNKEMIQLGNNNFSCSITEYFSNELDLNYFFIIEFKDGGVVSHPMQDKYLIDIIPYEDEYWDNINASDEVELLILNPLPNSRIDKEDAIIAVSMFSVKYVDINNIKITIDNKDITDKALINNNFLSIPKLDLSKGKHTVSIYIVNKFGVKFKPYSWSFIVKGNNDQTWFNKKINQQLRYWSSYSDSKISQNNIEYYDHNLTYNINLDWIELRSNFKISSLENIYEQSKNRYSVNLKNKNTELYLGDFNPYFNSYILNGQRVRGFNLNSNNNVLSNNLSLSINFIKGELNRVIQGNPNSNSVYISQVDTLNKILTISRDDYTFRRELSALKLGIGFYEKIFWNINLFKAKDNINSVYNIIPDAMLEVNQNYISNFNSNYLYSQNSDTTYLVQYDDFSANYNDFIYSVDSINYLVNDWGGEKPKDNFIIGSELLFNLDEGKTVIHSEFNLSMLNENLWNSITEISQLDTLGSDTLQDGLFMGNPLSEAEKILEYSDVFQLGFDQVPYFPYDQNSDNKLKALFNMPSAVYEFDAKFNYGNHSIKYIYEKIGAEFHSLGNLYTQKNIVKKTISDRMRFFENRLYIYIDYTRQKEGLDLTEDNIVNTNSSTFNLSLYPGADLPNINVGFSNQNRFNDISEAYFSDDSTVVSDTREYIYTSNYNISISDKILLFKEHNIFFSMFISDKKDMLFREKIFLDSNYYSPRSYNKNMSLGVLSSLNENWKSNIVYNNSNFNNGNEGIDSLNYYQEQEITSLDLSLRYSGKSLLDKFKIGFNSVSGLGYQDFIYYNFNLSATHEIIYNFKILWTYDYQMKWIGNDNMYNDSIFRIKLSFNL